VIAIAKSKIIDSPIELIFLTYNRIFYNRIVAFLKVGKVFELSITKLNITFTKKG